MMEIAIVKSPLGDVKMHFSMVIFLFLYFEPVVAIIGQDGNVSIYQ